MFRKLIYLLACLLIFVGCKKTDKIFTLKTIQLNHYSAHQTNEELLWLKVLDTDLVTVLAETDRYPSKYTLPARFAIHPSLPLPLYAQHYTIQLWGDSTGLLGECIVDMDDYKIVFPIDMEVDSETLGVSIQGSWQ